MTEKAKISLGDAELEVPVVVGTENEHAIDIAQLRAKTGYVTLDPAFMNTASTKSAITFIDGDKGILRYRGIPIEQLARALDVRRDRVPADLRRPAERKAAANDGARPLTRHSLIHEDMKHFFEGFPPTAPPDGDPVGDGGGALELLPGRARRRQRASSATSPSRA